MQPMHVRCRTDKDSLHNPICGDDMEAIMSLGPVELLSIAVIILAIVIAIVRALRRRR